MDVKYDSSGLVPAIVQDAQTGQVLMLAYMNREALELTLRTRETHFWSRSRAEIWHKGATSGNLQHVVATTAPLPQDSRQREIEAYALQGDPALVQSLLSTRCQPLSR